MEILEEKTDWLSLATGWYTSSHKQISLKISCSSSSFLEERSEVHAV